MKIYFCGSIRAGRSDVDLYARIIGKLKHFGPVLTEFVGDKSITADGSEHQGGDRDIHDEDVKLLEESQVIVAEVTQPSLGVGYEIGRGVAMGKKILCLYRPKDAKFKLSGMIRGLPPSVATVVDYEEPDLDTIFRDYF